MQVQVNAPVKFGTSVLWVDWIKKVGNGYKVSVTNAKRGLHVRNDGPFQRGMADTHVVRVADFKDFAKVPSKYLDASFVFDSNGNLRCR